MQFSANIKRADANCLTVYFIIQASLVLCDYLHNLALTQLENLHDNFQFNTNNMQ